MTTPEITAALGISKARLNELARQGRIPRGAKRGDWDLAAVRAALGRNIDALHKERQAAAAAPTPIRPAARAFDQPPPPAMDVPRGSLAAAQLVKAQAEANIQRWTSCPVAADPAPIRGTCNRPAPAAGGFGAQVA